jgi:hypothetical protein
LFLGDVTSWLDPALVALNPQLPAWFNTSGASTHLQLIVGASAPTDAINSAKLLFDVMAQSDWAAQNAWAFEPRPTNVGPDSNPFIPVLARSAIEPGRANFTLINIEDRLTIEVGTVSGAVSYRPIGGGSEEPLPPGADPATTVRETIPSSTDALKKCAAEYTNPSGYSDWTEEQRSQHMAVLGDPEVQRHRFIDARNPDPGCWPLSSLVSFVAKKTYSTVVSPAACKHGLHSLEFINYIATSDILSLPAESFGLVRLGEFPAIRDFTLDVLHSATCDGSALLVIPPVHWTVNSAITGFGQAMAAIGLFAVLVSLGLVLIFRHKVIIRSSSVPFLCAILVGMALLRAAMIPWSVEPTAASCSSFLWLINLGFMLLFCPLFAKTWRVYRIFSGAHLKVVKISNVKLLAGTAAIIALDVILIGVWQGVSPLVPVQYDRIIGSDQHVFTHCSVESSGAGLVFAALVGVEKAALLLFGAIMAFSTRNVKSTFNESTQISWTIYNTLMSGLIGVAIIVFVSAVEDALVLLVLILLTWVVLSAWGLLFVPKLYMLFLSDEKIIEASRSQITQEQSNGFSFASIAAMTSGQVKQFYVALKLQVNKAESVLKLPRTMWPSDGGVTVTAQSNGQTGSSGDRRVSDRPGPGGKLSAGKTILGDIKEQHPNGRQFPLGDKDHEHDERTVLSGRPSQQTLQHRRPTPPPLHSAPERRHGHADLPLSQKHCSLGNATDTIVRSNSRGTGSRSSGGAESPGMVESSAGSVVIGGGGIGSHHGGWVGSSGHHGNWTGPGVGVRGIASTRRVSTSSSNVHDVHAAALSTGHFHHPHSSQLHPHPQPSQAAPSLSQTHVQAAAPTTATTTVAISDASPLLTHQQQQQLTPSRARHVSFDLTSTPPANASPKSHPVSPSAAPIYAHAVETIEEDAMTTLELPSPPLRAALSRAGAYASAGAAAAASATAAIVNDHPHHGSFSRHAAVSAASRPSSRTIVHETAAVARTAVTDLAPPPLSESASVSASASASTSASASSSSPASPSALPASSSPSPSLSASCAPLAAPAAAPTSAEVHKV